MPTYEYACSACQHTFEHFQSITAKPLRDCPKCGRKSLQRLIGTGGGIIFKGSGFYQTDYRSESYRKALEAEKKQAAPAGDSAAAKPAAKGAAKAAGAASAETPAPAPAAPAPSKPPAKPVPDKPARKAR